MQCKCYVIVILYCLGNNDQKKSVHVQYRHNQHRPNYIVQVSNKLTFFSCIFLSIVVWICECVMHGYGGPTVFCLSSTLN